MHISSFIYGLRDVGSMLNKNIIHIFLFLIIILLISFASPLPPQPECFITAQVLEYDVSFFPYSELAVESGIGTDVIGERIQILSINESESANECSHYTVGSEFVLSLNLDSREAQIIEGRITERGDEYGSYYVVYGLVVLTENNTTDLTYSEARANNSYVVSSPSIFVYDSTFFILLIICLVIVSLTIVMMKLSK